MLIEEVEKTEKKGDLIENILNILGSDSELSGIVV